MSSQDALEDQRPVITPRISAERLGMPFLQRIKLATTAAFLMGVILGFPYGGQTSALRFRAENSHRFPTSEKGWYLYHKSKNYYVMRGSIKEGAKMATRLGLCVAAFFAIEEAIDEQRYNRDFMSTTFAGLTVAGAFSLWSMKSSSLFI